MKLALVFPGQGSQVVSMAKRTSARTSRDSRLVFEEASDATHLNIKSLCFNGPIETLTLTPNLQPALFTGGGRHARGAQIARRPRRGGSRRS